jgi:hypothetical protein
MTMDSEDIGFTETRAEKKLRVSASIKMWVIIAVTTSSLGFSLGLWAAQGKNASADIAVIQDTLKRMPPPDLIANKEMVDLQIKNLMDKLNEIGNDIKDVKTDLRSHQEETLKMYRSRSK